MRSLESRKRTTCWLALVLPFSQKVMFGWIEFQPKLRSSRGKPLGRRCLLWIGPRKEGDNFLIVVFLCGCEEETVNHILIHCTVARVLWDIVLVLFGAQWVFPETVKEVLFSWRGSFMGKKMEKDLEIHSIVHFLDGLEGDLEGICLVLGKYGV